MKDNINMILKNKKVLYGIGFLFLLFVAIAGYFMIMKNPFSDSSTNIQASNDIRRIDIPFNGGNSSSSIGNLTPVNSIVSEFAYNYCNFDGSKAVCPYNTSLNLDDLNNHLEFLTGRNNFYLNSVDLSIKDNESNLVFSYSGDMKFQIVSGGNYTNSGNNIIFSNNRLLIKFNNDTNFGGPSFASGDFLLINNINILPQFYNINLAYDFSGKNLSYDFDMFKNIFDYSKTRKQAKDNNINYQIYDKVGLSGQFIFSGYSRNSLGEWKLSLNKDNGEQIQNINYSHSGSYISLDFRNLSKDTNYIINLTNGSYNYIIKFTTIGDFKVVSQKNYAEHPAGADYNLNYHVCFNQPLDENSVRSAFESAIGSGNISMVFSNNTGSYDSLTGRQYCTMFYYYLNPEIENKFTVKGSKSIFGESVDFELSIPKHAIPDSYKFVTVNGNLINLLPQNGYWGDRLQIGYKNLTGGNLSVRSCRFKDPSSILSGLNVNSEDLYGTYKDIIYSLLDCGEIKTTKISFIDFQWWKNKVVEKNIKDVFSGNNASIFELSFLDLTKNPGKIFFKSNIGLVTKYAQGNLNIWANYLDTGAPVESVDILVGYLSGNKIQTINLPNSTGFVSLKIPSFDYGNMGFVVGKKGADQSFVVFPDNLISYQSGGYYNYFNNSFYADISQLGFEPVGYERNGDFRVYGYSDRALYKAGDKIYYSGFLRKSGSAEIGSGTVSVTLQGPDYTTVFSQSFDKFDEFGGFSGDFTLSPSAKLGSYYILFNYTNGSVQKSYYSYIKVQEFKKSSYFLDKTFVADNQGNKYMRLYPKYYFGSDLKNIDFSLNYSLKGQHSGIWDWTQCGSDYCSEPYYFSKTWGEDEYTGGNTSLSGYTRNYIDIPYGFKSKFVSNFDMDVTIVDTQSKEVVAKNFSETVYPDYLVGFKGWDYDWIDLNAKNSFIEGKVLKFKNDTKEGIDNYEKVNGGKVKIITYFKDYSYGEEQGPDGEWYYAGENYKKSNEQDINIGSDGVFKYDLKTDKIGKYFIRAIYGDGYEVQKTLNVYGDNYDMYSNVYGDMTNNFKLNVFAKEKNYEDNEDVDINIEPYIKGAYAIINVEQDNKLLENQIVKLDGQQIKVKAKKDRYPNAYISVSLIVGENINKTLSENRQEPRWLMGYTNLKISPQAMKLKYDITVTDLNGNTKYAYQPGEKVKLNISVKDMNDKPVSARLSVGIVDKALIDIYDEIKKPLESFYSYVTDSFQVSTNMKLLYKALKVFAADGTKGGGGGDGGGEGFVALFQPRKSFLDVAYWNGGLITDSNGNISFETTLPDNLTTWMVEVIGISKQLQLGSQRYFFKTSKDVIVEPNIPQFITFGDKITVPVNIIKNNDRNYSLKGTLKIGDFTKDISFYTKDINYFDIDMNQIPFDKVLNSDKIYVSVSALDGNNILDEVEYNIPVRKDGFSLNKILSFQGNTYSGNISLDNNAKLANIKVSFSTLPLEAFSKAVKYLIHYPYGCSEQLLSGLFPIVVSKDLASKGFVGNDIISGGTVYINGEFKAINEIVVQTLTSLYKNQKSDGLFGYWTDTAEKSNQYLSVYVYSVLRYLENQGYSIDKEVINKLEISLNNISDKTLRMYYLMQKTINGDKVDKMLIRDGISTTGNAVNVFAYVALAYLGENDARLETTVKAMNFDKIGNGGYLEFYLNPYVNKNILLSYFARGLIKNNKIEDAQKIIFDFNKNKDKNGVWGWSTQENLQIILAMADYFKKMNPENKTISYNALLNGQSFSGVLNQSGFYSIKTFTLNDIKDISFSFNSSESIITDVSVEYIPSDLNNIKDDSKNVSDLSLNFSGGKSILGTAKIGETVNASASFKIDKEVSNLAVTYNIPSNFYIVNPDLSNSPDNYSNYFNFENLGSSSIWYSCWPTHYEVRFDQLFMYYENLPAGSSCKVNLNLMKTHDGSVNLIPLKLWEMYGGEVYANKFVR